MKNKTNLTPRQLFHLFSNWKWTGPAEPALRLFLASQQLPQFHPTFLCGRPPSPNQAYLRKHAQQQGVHALDHLYLHKHLHPLKNLYDTLALTHLCYKKKPALLHAHQLNDHLICAMTKLLYPRTKIVRTSYHSTPPPPHWRNRLLLKHFCDALLVISPKLQQQTLQLFPYLQNKIHHIEVGVDLQRFNPHRPLPNPRPKWGIQPSDTVIGIVARMQKHRKFQLLLQAIQQLAQTFQHFKVLIVGRGTHQNTVAKQPVQQLQLENIVRFTGYLEGDDYVAALKIMDIKVLMVPGSDGSCRAVREAMAMKTALAVGNTGILPELITRSQSGLVFDYTTTSIVQCLKTLLSNPKLRNQYAQAAWNFAQNHFPLEKTKEKLLQIYSKLI